ncbi:Glu-tRNA(Gln) amidotransferase subunit GatE [Nanoarchaeota archaeon]
MAHDYKKLGFKSGIEIHQQIEGKKLFCNCPTEIRKDEPDFSVKRRLRASAGETGKADIAALYEMGKQKHYLYQGYEDSTCLVELDESPPRPLNPEALAIVFQVCKMLNAKVVDQIQVMRKIVIDGSNTTGFQRTALIGRDGYIEVNGKRIGIPTICLEEEACQVMKRTKTHDVYNLSRLGIPLIEIATDPDMATPEEARDVAAKLGMILRSTGKMKRGIGSIRQDVNMSIKGAGRIEIKGFQDLRSIPKVIDKEIDRQLKLTKQGKKIESHVRKAEPDFSTSFLRPMPGAARMYPETDIPKIVSPDTKAIKVPKLIEHQAEDYEKDYKLPKGYGQQLVKAGIEFDDYAKKYSKIEPVLLAEFFIKIPKDLKSRENVEIDPKKQADILEQLNKGKIPKSALNKVLLLKAKGKKVDYSKYSGAGDSEIRKAVKEAIAKDPKAPIGALMGQVMAKLKGRADGKKVMELLKEQLDS